jgi:hypothetical protein
MCWIIATRQLAKFVFLNALFSLLGFADLFIVFGGGTRTRAGMMTGSTFVVAFSSNIGSLLAFVGLCLAIRCPACGERVFWWAVGKQPLTAGLAAFFKLKACPSCGSVGAGSRGSSGRS